MNFAIEPSRRALLLEGLDSIAATLRLEAAITDFEAADRKRRPWVYRTAED